MAKFIGIVAVVALICVLGSAIIASWIHNDAKDDFLKLVQALLSWQVIAGGLAVGGAKTFEGEIRQRLNRT